MNNLAPVLITVYDRLDCLQNAINYLSRGGAARKKYKSIHSI